MGWLGHIMRFDSCPVHRQWQPPQGGLFTKDVDEEDGCLKIIIFRNVKGTLSGRKKFGQETQMTGKTIYDNFDDYRS